MNDPGCQPTTPPSLPEKFDDLDDNQRGRETELHRRRLVHYHYVNHTYKSKILHFTALADPIRLLLRLLINNARAPWEGETYPLKVALIGVTKKWETLLGGGVSFPIAFDPEDVRGTMKR